MSTTNTPNKVFTSSPVWLRKDFYPPVKQKDERFIDIDKTKDHPFIPQSYLQANRISMKKQMNKYFKKININDSMQSASKSSSNFNSKQIINDNNVRLVSEVQDLFLQTNGKKLNYSTIQKKVQLHSSILKPNNTNVNSPSRHLGDDLTSSFYPKHGDSVQKNFILSQSKVRDKLTSQMIS